MVPDIPRRDSHLARSLHRTRVLKEDEIWETSIKVWETSISSKVGNTFVLAKKVAEKVIQSNGGNDFLCNAHGSLSAGVRNYFVEPDKGATRIDGAFFPFTLAKGTSLKNVAPTSTIEPATKDETPMERCILEAVAIYILMLVSFPFLIILKRPISHDFGCNNMLSIKPN